MRNIEEFSKLMQSDWDRRIKHDYRFWMSDGHSDDETMWSSGKRDFEILTKGIDFSKIYNCLEVGCGVGRILSAAASVCPKVMGVDISEVAIEKARGLLGEHENIELIHGNGFDLKQVQSKSLDLVISFAALCSMPVDIVARYLCEINRITKGRGSVRLQVYLGTPQKSHKNDTLFPRAYRYNEFKTALKLLGFKIESIEELILPFQVSYKELGIEANIVSLIKEKDVEIDHKIISEALLPEGEQNLEVSKTDNELEYWMSLSYARELLSSGKLIKAKEALEYAACFSNNTTTDVKDLLQRVEDELDKNKPLNHLSKSIDGNILELNLRVLEDKFPEIAKVVKENLNLRSSEAEIKKINNLPVVLWKGVNLDHPSKPVEAGLAWAKRELQSKDIKNAKHLCVFGFSSGYHLESLIKETAKEVSVIEPNLEVFLLAVKNRDLREVFVRLIHIVLGKEPDVDFFDSETELLVRPQTQSFEFELLNTIKTKFYGKRGVATLKPQIGVVGPMQGGTLPMLEYSSRSLAMMGQRVRQIDMQKFASGFSGVSDNVTNELLRAKAQGRYIESLSEVILDSVTEKPVDILICMAQAPLSTKVLQEIRKRGIITALWFVEDYTRFTTWQVYAKHFDYIFTIQKDDCINAIKAAGCPNVHYLPTACDPVIHHPLTSPLSEEEKARWGSDVSFVGAGYHNRQQLFAYLTASNFKIWGTEWPNCRPFNSLVQEEGRRISPEEYIKIFNSSKINLNLHSSTERDGVDPSGDFINPRTFELASAGAFQLVDPRVYLGDFFEVGKEITTFQNISELKEKISYYLDKPEERAEIANKARQKVLSKHTYQHRLEEMLSVIYSNHYEHIRSRLNSSPWVSMIEKTKSRPELNKRCRLAFNKGEEPGLDALVADIVTGKGELTETEQKLLFLFHLSKQTIRMKKEEQGL